jgi:hypothetical protein
LISVTQPYLNLSSLRITSTRQRPPRQRLRANPHYVNNQMVLSVNA